MPSRVIKESFLTSQSVARLSTAGEVHFLRLTLLKDDWGCFEASPAVVKGACYTYHKKITEKMIFKLHAELEENGDLRFWTDGDRVFGVFVSHDKHDNRYSVTDTGDQTRHRRKTPEPPESIFTEQYKPIFSGNTQIITNHNALLKQVSNPNPVPNHNPNPKNTLSADADPYINEIVSCWNKIGEKKASELDIVACQKLTASRLSKLKTRLKDKYFAENWKEALRRAYKSSFIRGITPRGAGFENWRADFEWFLKPDTVTKLMEGKHDDKTKTEVHEREAD